MTGQAFSVSREERRLWIVLVISMAAVALVLIVLLFYGNKNPAYGRLHPGRTDARSPLAFRPLERDEKQASPEAAFSNAMDRFGASVRDHPKLSGEEMVAKANQRVSNASAKPCPFEWHKGEAELELQRNQAGELSIPDAVNSCSSAIARLPK